MVVPSNNIASMQVAGFIFSQDTPRKDKVLDYLRIINEIEREVGLIFLIKLPNDRYSITM